MFQSTRRTCFGSSLHHALISCSHTKVTFCPALFRVHAVRLLQNWLGSQSRHSRAIRLLRRQIESCDRIRLAVGSESHCSENWIPAASDQIDLVNPGSWSSFLQKSSVDAILAERVWGHLSEHDSRTAARNCFQFLRPGGYLRVAVPDGFHPSQQRKTLQGGVGSETGVGGGGRLYNHLSFADVFLAVGFQVQMIEFFDQEGVFHSNHWDVSKGLVKRSLLFDERNIAQPFAYTSLVLDAVKPGAAVMGLEAGWAGTRDMAMIGSSDSNVGCQGDAIHNALQPVAA